MQLVVRRNEFAPPAVPAPPGDDVDDIPWSSPELAGETALATVGMAATVTEAEVTADAAIVDIFLR